MSKERQAARARREAAAAERAAAARQAAERDASGRARRERRAEAWRRVRLWQHGTSFRRNRERWGALATLALMTLLVVYLATRSFEALFVAAVVLLLAGPVLVLLFVDRRTK